MQPIWKSFFPSATPAYDSTMSVIAAFYNQTFLFLKLSFHQYNSRKIQIREAVILTVHETGKFTSSKCRNFPASNLSQLS